MATVLIEWQGATDDVGIAGYELSYKKSTDTNWEIEPFIPTSSSSADYTLSGLDTGTVYNFRVRTKDVEDLWSVDYAETSLEIINPIGIQRNTTGIVDNGTTFLCSSEPLAIDCFITTIIGLISIGDIVYNDALLEDPFDGENKYWTLTSGITCKIGGNGEVLDIKNCNAIEFFRSTPYNPGDEPACTDIVLTNTSVFVTKSLLDLEVGDFVFTNSDFSTPLNGNSKVFALGATQFDTVLFLIGSTGRILEVIQICTND